MHFTKLVGTSGTRHRPRDWCADRLASARRRLGSVVGTETLEGFVVQAACSLGEAISATVLLLFRLQHDLKANELLRSL
jgi:hypothetical protein